MSLSCDLNGGILPEHIVSPPDIAISFRKAHEIGMPLDAMSVEELAERIGLLETEIARLKVAIEAKKKSRDAAAAFFKS